MVKKWWDNMLAMIGLGDSEEDEYEQYAQTEQETDLFREKFKDKYTEREREKKEFDDELTLRRRMRKSTLVSVPGSGKNSRISVYQPVLYEEVQEIADQLKSGRAVLINLEHADRDNAAKVVNFLSGTIYALNGDMHRVGQGILLFTPEQVDVQLPLNGIRFESRHM